MPHILVIEDDFTASEAIAEEFKAGGYEVTQVSDGRQGLEMATHLAFDAITLDRKLPGMSGIELLKKLRKQDNDTPVLIISASSKIDDRIEGLRAGGDDYLGKPFALQEMIARMEVLLRRQSAYKSKGLLFTAHLEIDLVQRQVRLCGNPIKLLHKEFNILEFLVRKKGLTVSRTHIFEHVWGHRSSDQEKLINVYIARLRSKLVRSGHPSLIQTVSGVGYRLIAD